MKQALSLLAVTLGLTAWLFIGFDKDNLDTSYSRSTFKDDIKQIEVSGTMDSTELILMTLYISRGELAGTSFEGKTYSHILRDAKAFEKNQLSKKNKS